MVGVVVVGAGGGFVGSGWGVVRRVRLPVSGVLPVEVAVVEEDLRRAEADLAAGRTVDRQRGVVAARRRIWMWWRRICVRCRRCRVQAQDAGLASACG